MMHNDHNPPPKTLSPGPPPYSDPGSMSDQHRYLSERQSCWAEISKLSDYIQRYAITEASQYGLTREKYFDLYNIAVHLLRAIESLDPERTRRRSVSQYYSSTTPNRPMQPQSPLASPLPPQPLMPPILPPQRGPVTRSDPGEYSLLSPDSLLPPTNYTTNRSTMNMPSGGIGGPGSMGGGMGPGMGSFGGNGSMGGGMRMPLDLESGGVGGMGGTTRGGMGSFGGNGSMGGGGMGSQTKSIPSMGGAGGGLPPPPYGYGGPPPPQPAQQTHTPPQSQLPPHPNFPVVGGPPLSGGMPLPSDRRGRDPVMKREEDEGLVALTKGMTQPRETAQKNMTGEMYFEDMQGEDKKKRRRKNIYSARRNLHCHACGVTETPEWRRGPDGDHTLCNACGLHYAKALKKEKEEREKSAHITDDKRKSVDPTALLHEKAKKRRKIDTNEHQNGTMSLAHITNSTGGGGVSLPLANGNGQERNSIVDRGGIVGPPLPSLSHLERFNSLGPSSTSSMQHPPSLNPLSSRYQHHLPPPPLSSSSTSSSSGGQEGLPPPPGGGGPAPP